MKTELLYAIEQFLVIQLNHWYFYPVAFSFSVLLKTYNVCDELNLVEWGACGLVLFSFYFIRRFSKNLGISVALHCIAPIAVIFLTSGNLSHCILCTIDCIVFTAISINRHIKDNIYDKAINIYVELGIVLVLLLIMNYYDFSEYNGMLCIMVIVLTAVYVIQLYLGKFLLFVKMNIDSTGHMPFGDIFKSGFGMVIFFTVILVGISLLLFFVNAESLDNLTKGIFSLPGVIIALLFKLIAGNQKATTDDTLHTSPLQTDELADFQSEGSSAANVVYSVFSWIILAIIVVVLVKIFFSFVKWVKEHWKFEQITEEGTVDIREKIKKSSGGGTVRKRGPRGFSNEARVRRLYIKSVRSGHKKIIGDRPISNLGYFTARECGKALQLQNMAGIYEKTRYSGQTITSEDVSDMKKAVKGSK